MKLLRLTLRGFKSFADKTTIEFAEGMTVIVGPNGCGKSNISDAVRWVLGEQNVRNIRGRKAEDMIFSGSETRSAKQAAEVTLVLDNSAHELDIDATEVSITRRILRSGDSEFQLNKRNCRLKDIHELLATTGLGRDSLAIIGQNRVDQVLTARPEERRLIFEDVAGISLYRMRKEEGLRKLGRTTENMDRVKDMMALLEEQLIPLKAAAEKTKTYKTLVKEKEGVEATMSLLRLASSRRMLSRYEKEYRDLTDESVVCETALAKFSAEREQLEKESLVHQAELQKRNEAVTEKQKAADTIRGDFRVKTEALRHEEEQRIRLVAEEEDQTLAEAELAEELAVAEGELTQAKEDYIAKQSLFEEAERERNEAAVAWEAEEEKRQSVLDVSRKQLVEKERWEQHLVHLREDAKRMTQERESARSVVAEQESTLQSVQAEWTALQEEENRISQILKVSEERVQRERQALKEGEEQLHTLSRAWDTKQALLRETQVRRAYLQQADKEYRDFSQATQLLLKNRSLWDGHTICALGELLHVPPKYADAAEVAFGGSISYIVTDTSQVAAEMVGWLKEHRGGRTTFYPLDAMKPRFNDRRERDATAEVGICGIAVDLFSYDEEYADLMAVLLGRTLIAEDLAVARRISKKYNHALRIVTLDGQIIHAGGSMTGGSMKRREHTFFGRKKEINRLLSHEASLEEEVAGLKRQKEEQERACAQLSDAVTASREGQQEAEVGKATCTERKAAAHRRLQLAEEALRKSQATLKEKEERMAEVERCITIEEEKATAFATLVAVPDSAESIRLKGVLAEKEEALVESRIALTKAEESVHFQERLLEERQSAKVEQKEDRGKLEKDKATNVAALARLQEEAQVLNVRFEKAEVERLAAEQALTDYQNQSERFAVNRKSSDEEWREVQTRLATVQRDMAERKARIEHFREEVSREEGHLQERGLTEEQAEALRLEGTMAEMKDRLTDVTGRIADLGAVNLQGEEDYEGQLRRRDFYRQQLDDLEQAKEGLQKVVNDIDKTMSIEFLSAFRKVNEEFSRVMKLMFQGGKARLELTDEEHPLEGGVEMYLQMPGKKRQPLTLMSGGERALTVIALLISFMAYRPAPFCFVDEIDAALDEANVARYSCMIADYKKKTQFIVISHRKKTMEFADTLQGVTMGEKGVSSLVTVRMSDYIKEA